MMINDEVVLRSQYDADKRQDDDHGWLLISNPN